MSLDTIHFQPLTTVAKHIQAGDISPVEVTEAILTRIRKFFGLQEEAGADHSILS